MGVDLSAHLLEQAAQAGPAFRADLRRLPFRDGSFSIVAAFFTVFGYLETRQDDEALFRELVRIVAPGGHLHLDLPDPSQVRATLVPSDRRELPGLVVEQRRWIAGDQVFKEIVATRDGGASEQYLERVRLWERDELDALAASCGMRCLACLGNAQGDDWAPGMPRFSLIWTREA